MSVDISDADLLLRLRNFEDNFVERKTIGDIKDSEKTVAAFANSTPIGYPAVLFVGVRNDGTVEDLKADLESVQRSVAKRIQKVYPPVYVWMKVLNVDGRQCLAVIVPGSEKRPHFTGPSYVRVGSDSVVANQSMFDAMIAQRLSKPYEILRWKDKLVTVDELSAPSGLYTIGRIASTQHLTVVDCTAFYVTLKDAHRQLSYALDRVSISYDTERDRLRLEVAQ